MEKYANNVVKQAQAWLGYNEADGSHKEIINVYNSQKKLPRSYPVKFTDQWCATFVSAVSIKVGYTDIIPTECGCNQMIALFQKLGAWNESDSRVPNPGDIIFYDWQDSGSGDNRNGSDHVGIVEKVVGDTITVIEGNYSQSVKRRNIRVNGKYIRGYGVPKYDVEAASKQTGTTAKTGKNESSVNIAVNVLKKGSKGDDVLALQILLRGLGYNGKMSKKLDGIFGSNTEGAVKLFQKAKGLTVDGIVGAQTWGSLLGGEKE